MLLSCVVSLTKDFAGSVERKSKESGRVVEGSKPPPGVAGSGADHLNCCHYQSYMKSLQNIVVLLLSSVVFPWKVRSLARSLARERSLFFLSFFLGPHIFPPVALSLCFSFFKRLISSLFLIINKEEGGGGGRGRGGGGLLMRVVLFSFFIV